MLTLAEQAKIDIALESTGGNFDNAAALIGMDAGDLKSEVMRVEALNTRWYQPAYSKTWTPKNAPTEGETISREQGEALPPDQGRVLSTERQIAESINAEESKMSQRLENMGLTMDEVALARNCRAFANKHFSHILQFMAGGVTKASIKIMTQMGEVEIRLRCVRGVLNDLDQIRTEDRDAWVEEETRLANMYVQLSGELRRNWEIANKGAQIISVMRRRHERGIAGVSKKPKFEPEPIEVEA